MTSRPGEAASSPSSDPFLVKRHPLVAWFDEMLSGVDISYSLNAAYGELETEQREWYKHNVSVGVDGRDYSVEKKHIPWPSAAGDGCPTPLQQGESGGVKEEEGKEKEIKENKEKGNDGPLRRKRRWMSEMWRMRKRERMRRRKGAGRRG
ncbi:unnamed protein product [Boreogadus saida]